MKTRIIYNLDLKSKKPKAVFLTVYLDAARQKINPEALRKNNSLLRGPFISKKKVWRS
jgi:hypothetical protein